MSENKKGLGLGGIVLICITALLIAGGFIFKDRILGNERGVPIGTESEFTMTENPTVESKLMQRNAEIEMDRLLGIYYTLPISIIQKIYEDHGANITHYDVAREYEKNAEYYMSFDISSQYKPQLNGPDAKNVERIEIKTKLKKPQEEEATRLPITPVDSVR